MFRATMCPSSEETPVFMRHFVRVILYGLLSGVQGGMKLIVIPIMATCVAETCSFLTCMIGVVNRLYCGFFYIGR